MSKELLVPEEVAKRHFAYTRLLLSTGEKPMSANQQIKFARGALDGQTSAPAKGNCFPTFIERSLPPADR